MYLAGKSIREIRHACQEGTSGAYPEQVFWVGNHTTPTIDMVVHFANIATWLLQECHGDKTEARKQIHQMLVAMEWQLCEMLGLFTSEEDAQKLCLPPNWTTRNDAQR